MRIKGPWFPSFERASGNYTGPSGRAGKGRSLPAGKQYIGFDGMKSRTKNLKRACRALLESKDPEVIETIAYVRDLLKNEPNSEYAVYFILFNANNAIQDSEINLKTAVEFLLKKFGNEIKKEPNVSDNGEGVVAAESGAVSSGLPEGE